jgi:hypothetical protein
MRRLREGKAGRIERAGNGVDRRKRLDGANRGMLI